MLKIEYDKRIEAPAKTDIEKYLTPFIWLVPGWVQLVFINLWASEADGTHGETISIKVNYDYRSVVLHFCSSWLNQPEADKQEQVLHELLHIHLSLIADYARDNFDILCEKSDAPKYNKTLQEGLRERHESATQDLAKAIYERFRVSGCPGQKP